MIDIDHFKKFNDTYGHLVGDKVLKEVAQIIQKTCRITDIPTRFGGEEFAILLPQTNPQGAEVLAERIRKNIQNADLIHN